MRLVSLDLKEGYLAHRKLFFSPSTLICSYNNNKRGKTTLIRLIIYSLGFNIPSIAGIDFSQIESIIEVEVKGERITLERKSNVIFYSSKGVSLTFILPRQENELFALLFGTSNIYILQNILGAMYVDQTHGSVVLNRGKVISGINFSIETLIAGIQGNEISNIKERIKNEKKVLKDYKAMKAIAEYMEENDIDYVDVENSHNMNESQVKSKEVVLKSDLKKISGEIKDIEASIISNESFLNTIESYMLYVLDDNKKKIKVDSNSIIGYKDNSNILKAHLNVLKLKKTKIQNEISKLDAYTKTNELEIDADYFKKSVDNSLQNLKIDLNTINSLVKSTKKEISALNKEVQNKIQTDSTVIDFMNSVIKRCAKKMNVFHLVDNKGVLTRNIKNKSGTNYYQLIISFKISYIKTLQKFCNINLPLILDSLRQNELSEKNAEVILEVIKEELPNHQVILSSIYDYSKLFKHTIEIKNRVIE